MGKVEFRKFLPEGVDKEPETVLEALRAAREVFAEEGRWMTGDWFKNLHPEVDPEDPFCNSWQVCIEGGVAMVTIGAVRAKDYSDMACETPGGFGYKTAGDVGLAMNHWQSSRYPYFPGYGLYVETCDALVDAAPEGLGHRLVDIDDDDIASQEANWFNDSVCQTRQDVLDWFDAAIRKQEAKQSATAG